MSIGLEALAQLGELAGGVAVVVSLVYLAYQVRQNTHSLRTESYARALDRVAAMQARLSSDADFSAVLTRGSADPAALGPLERAQLAWAFYEMFGAFEFMFHQAKSRALPDEVWRRWSDTLAWWISLPGVAAWWDTRPAPFTASFAAHVEARRRDGPPDRDAAARWAAFVRTGGAPRESEPEAAA